MILTTTTSQANSTGRPAADRWHLDALRGDEYELLTR